MTCHLCGVNPALPNPKTCAECAIDMFTECPCADCREAHLAVAEKALTSDLLLAGLLRDLT